MACGREGAPLPGDTDPEAGRRLIVSYGCGNCHRIPGIRGARGDVGPPLTRFGRRSFIAGEIPNTPVNLVQWIMAPQSVESGTAMPTLGVPQSEARQIAAYLFTLR
jgi:cytochrome c